jgi:H+/Cl- antiporter ClcA
MRVWVGIYVALAAAAMALAGLFLLYGVVARIDSWPERFGALLIAATAALCTYYLAQLAKFVLGVYDLDAWQKSKMQVVILLILTAYGGLIPWLAYLTIDGHPVAWWALVFCLPFYLGTVWFVSREFRQNLIAAANHE